MSAADESEDLLDHLTQPISPKALAEKGSDTPADYDLVLTEVVWLLEDSRRASARAVTLS